MTNFNPRRWCSIILPVILVVGLFINFKNFVKNEVPSAQPGEINTANTDDVDTNVGQKHKERHNSAEKTEEQQLTIAKPEISFIFPKENSNSLPPVKIGYCFIVDSEETLDLRNLDVVVNVLQGSASPSLHVFTVASTISSLTTRIEHIFSGHTNVRVVTSEQGILHAQLSCIKTLKEMQKDTDYYVILSSDSFPLYSAEQIEQVLAHTAPISIISETCNVGEKSCSNQLYRRLPQHRKFFRCEPSCDFAGFPDGYRHISFGSRWVVLHKVFLDFVDNQEQSHSTKWLEYLTTAGAPEDIYFATLAHLPTRNNQTVPVRSDNSGGLLSHSQRAEGCQRRGKYNRHLPCILSEQEVQKAIESQKHLFARRFLSPPCFLKHVGVACEPADLTQWQEDLKNDSA